MEANDTNRQQTYGVSNSLMDNSSGGNTSLMPSSTFLSRYDKDIELGAAIKSQVDAGIPKGTLRAISSGWLNEYLGYIEKV